MLPALAKPLDPTCPACNYYSDGYIWNRNKRGEAMPERTANSNEDAPLTPAVFHILLALADGPVHGYAIMQSVKKTANLEMGPGTIYGSIQRMEDAALVREVEAPQLDGNGDRRRRYYDLTASGREALEVESGRVARLAELVRAKNLIPGGGAR